MPLTRRFYAVAGSVGIGTLYLGVASPLCAEEPRPVDFSRDVRPLLSQYCFACHGPDEASRESGLRLDRADAALAELASGATAVVPGKPEASELIARITQRRSRPADAACVERSHALGRANRNAYVAGSRPDAKIRRPLVVSADQSNRNRRRSTTPRWVRNPIDAFISGEFRTRGGHARRPKRIVRRWCGDCRWTYSACRRNRAKSPSS